MSNRGQAHNAGVEVEGQEGVDVGGLDQNPVAEWMENSVSIGELDNRADDLRGHEQVKQLNCSEQPDVS